MAHAGSALIRAVLIGATGRMGTEILRAAPGFPQLIVTGAIASPDSLALGRDAGQVAGRSPLNLPVTADLPAALAQADVALDFSNASAAAANLAAARAARKPLLIGATGFAATLEREFAAAAREIALLVCANTSIAVAVLSELTRLAARSLPVSFDIDIEDLHHRGKKDAPSGTALALGAAAREGRGARPSVPRPGADIGFASIRAGDVVGEHTVRFTGHGEALSLTHRATDRGVFARGALAATLWLASRPPGRYGMADVLGFKTGT
jgi:4-hydroxy-tetrahydrodipicolinate reductase